MRDNLDQAHHTLAVELLEDCHTSMRCSSTLLPLITRVINSSLQSGVMPETMKKALVTPMIKKRDASPEDLSNYRPISNLSFLGKLIEKAAVKLIQEYISVSNLHNPLQSAHRPRHSVETALIRVQNDIFTALDQRKEVLLVLLDFTSAFDTIEHTTMHDRLKHLYGLGGTVLKWLKSYLSDRVHVVKVRDSLSDLVTDNCVVPQGSVIGPMLYTLYSAPISNCSLFSRKSRKTYAVYNEPSELWA